MRLSATKVKALCRANGITLSEALRRAGLSRRAYDALVRLEVVPPRSVATLGRCLRIRPEDLVTQDIDLWFADLADPGIRKALRTVGGTYVPPIGLHPPMFAGEAVALFDIVLRVHGIGAFEEEARSAITVLVDDVPVKVLPLDRIIASKKALNRPKDRLVLPVLKDALWTLRERTAHGKSRKKR